MNSSLPKAQRSLHVKIQPLQFCIIAICTEVIEVVLGGFRVSVEGRSKRVWS